MISTIRSIFIRCGLILLLLAASVGAVYADETGANKTAADGKATGSGSSQADSAKANAGVSGAPGSTAVPADQPRGTMDTKAASTAAPSAITLAAPGQAAVTPSGAASVNQAPAKPVVKPAAHSELPPPKGFEAVVKLYNAHKYASAAGEFEKFVKAGVADTNTHLYLAYCYYAQRIYSKAVQEFSWVAKNSHSISLQRDAENTVYTLNCYRRGVCPANCLKPNDPRWHRAHMDGFPDDYIWITFKTDGGSRSFSQHHMGDLIEMVNGDAVDKGTCPICGGTGKVPVLKDGQPLPSR
jgi:hypothetical protein